MLFCLKIIILDGIEVSMLFFLLILILLFLNKICGGGFVVFEVLEVVIYIGNDVKVFGFDEINRVCSEGSSECGVVIVGDVSIIIMWIGKDDVVRWKLVVVVCKYCNSY